MSTPRELPMLPMAPAESLTVDEHPDLDATGPGSGPAVRYRVEGMDCASCAKTVEKAVAALPGVRAADRLLR